MWPVYLGLRDADDVDSERESSGTQLADGKREGGSNRHASSRRFDIDAIELDDKLQVKSMKRAFRRSVRPQHETMSIAFKNLGFTLSGGQQILKRVNGSITPGRLSAIIGPSGSGKTTFLNVLSGRATGGVRTGSVRLNGVPDSTERFKRIIGFVPQSDATVIPDLTVVETLVCSASTRLPRHLSEYQRLLIVEETLDMLDLSAHRHTPVGKLSGGQARRLSLGVELVARPVVLLLDEPTSGLDATVAKHLVRTLRNLAATGMTIAAVIHQPRFEVFELFDDVLLMVSNDGSFERM
jgi:ABC-type multidrug transport system ATPase subunit